jgi:hypothetical protein
MMLAACSAGDDTSAGGVTQGESDALNNAAEVLDKQSPSPSFAKQPAQKPNSQTAR